MDEETRALIREGLDLYKRQLELMEANNRREVAVLEANSRRLTGWKPRVFNIIGVALMGLITGGTLAVLLPTMDHFLNR